MSSAPDIIRVEWYIERDTVPDLAQRYERRETVIRPTAVEVNFWQPRDRSRQWYATVLGAIVRKSDGQLSRVTGRHSYWETHVDPALRIDAAPQWVRDLVQKSLDLIPS